jgi:hypothetical protein
MRRLAEYILRNNGKRTRVFYGPVELSIVPKLNPFKFSPEGIELQKKYKSKYKKLLKDYTLWFQGQNSYYLEEGVTFRDFKRFPAMTAEKIFYLYQMILGILERYEYWERRIMEYAAFVGESFGEFPDENGNILFKADAFEDVIVLVLECTEIPDSQKERIAFILGNEVDQLELREAYEELKTVFNRWRAALPEEFSFLGIKSKSYSFHELVLHSTPLINEFTGFPYYRIRTKNEMISVLIEKTYSIFDNLETESLELENPEVTAMELSAKNAKLQIAKTTRQFDELELTYVDAIVQCLDIIENHLIKHKDTILSLKNTVKDVLGGVKLPIMSIREAALFCFYSEIHITRQNADKIVKQFKHNSGEKLFQLYSEYSSRANRINPPHPDTRKKFENKLSLFQSVIDKLDSRFQRKAMDEFNLLKIKFEEEHS